MSISLIKSTLILLVLVAFRATAADALFRSSFESSVCNTSLAEFEPNDTAITANVVPIINSALVCGVISQPADVDYFQISVANTSTMLIETIQADGVPCDPSAPVWLTLKNSSLVTIATNNNGGIGGCASLDGETSSSLQNLPPGNYYIEASVVSVPVSDPTPAYALSIKLL